MDIRDYTDPLYYRFTTYVEFGFFLECWNWRGATVQAAHSPQYRWGVLNVRGKAMKASRISWELNRAPIPNGINVLHSCDNPLCVNPGHLFLGTQAENVDDMDRKGRRRTVSRSGVRHHNAKLTGEQVARIKTHVGPARILAAEFGVTPEQVNNIKRGAQRRDG